MSTEQITNESVDCFVIMPISDQDGYGANHFQFVYEDIVQPAIKSCGMKPIRADDTKNSNLIQLDILRKIIETPIAICDISSKNPNVFFELGMRQAFDMPVVIIKDERTEAPFDISGLRYVTYQSDMAHRSVMHAVRELSININATYAKRDDKSEINSLIRLMDLANPAKLTSENLSEEARSEKLISIRLDELSSVVVALGNTVGSIDSQLSSWAKRNEFYKYNLASEIDKHINELIDRGLLDDSSPKPPSSKRITL